MTGLTFIGYELLQLRRNWRFVLISFAYPLIIFFAVAVPNRHKTFDGISFPLYFMAGMAVLGGMISVISTGARIGTERAAGWTRHLRITPLRARVYLSAKVLCGYLAAVVAIVVLCAAGILLGVRMPADEWLKFTGLLLAGLIPLAALGIALGHVVRSDALVPAVGGSVTLLAFLGGAYGFLLATSGVMFDIIKALPSYWLVQAAKTTTGGAWPAEGWVVVAAWSAILISVAVAAYRRDTSRA